MICPFTVPNFVGNSSDATPLFVALVGPDAFLRQQAAEEFVTLIDSGELEVFGRFRSALSCPEVAEHATPGVAKPAQSYLKCLVFPLENDVEYIKLKCCPRSLRIRWRGVWAFLCTRQLDAYHARRCSRNCWLGGGGVPFTVFVIH